MLRFIAEGNAEGRLSWKFDLSSVGLTILQVVVSCPATTYEDARICWKISGSEDSGTCHLLPNGSSLSPLLPLLLSFSL